MATTTAPTSANDPAPSRAASGPRILERVRSVNPALRRGLGLAAIVFVFALVVATLRRFAGDVSYDEVVAALLATSWWTVSLAVLLTACSYASLVLYDVFALRYVDRPQPLSATAFVSFCAYAVGNTAGFGPLSGGAVRYRFYSRLGLSPEAIAAVIGFVTVAFGTGLAVAAFTASAVSSEAIGPILHLPPDLLRWGAVLAIAAIVGGYLVLLRRTRSGAGGWLRAPSPAIAGGQLLATILDLFFSALVLYVLLPAGKPDLPVFLAIYTIAVASGVLSHVPAGLGVFETIILAAMPETVPSQEVLSALLLYRLAYHVLPLIAAALLVSGAEARRVVASPIARVTADAVARIAPLVLAALTLIAGAMLIFSSVTPAPAGDLEFLGSTVALPLGLVEAAHFASGVLGIILVVGSRGLAQRLDGAWWASVAAASLAAALCFLKAVAVFEAAFLALLLLALIPLRGRFDRPASLFREALSAPWLFAVAIILLSAGALLFFAYEDVEYSHGLWTDFAFGAEAPRSLRAFLGVCVVAGAVALWSLLRTALDAVAAPSAEELAQAVAILNRQPLADANLVRSGDKALLFSENRDAFLMYARQGRSFVSLFGPVGAPASAAELVWRFAEMAREGGGRAALYQIHPEMLPLCADAGLRAIKLGEAAIIPLKDFDLKGAKRSGLRQTVNRGERDGLRFEVVPVEAVPSVFEDLRRISDGWLESKGAREKRFSVGWFDRDYILSQPVALVRLEGRIVAFANILVTGTKLQSAIDLMRFAPDAPRSTMEFLLLSLMLHMRDEGYETFDLGMAPLSGLSNSPAAPLWNRIGGLVFDHAERFYNFRGLRAFKSKFDPDWCPRYLAVSGGLPPALALADISQLIAGGLTGVVSK